jgi:hypothetical protein
MDTTLVCAHKKDTFEAMESVKEVEKTAVRSTTSLGKVASSTEGTVIGS